jgi:xylulose-5-phosphate/fructose-6-phosphate phosphoketolase
MNTKTKALTPELFYPLLKEPLTLSHVKPLVVGHWGTTPGQNFIYVHLNRVIKKYDLDT